MTVLFVHYYRKGFDGDDDGNPDYNSATVLLVNYLLNNHVRDLENDMAMAWEAQLVDIVRSFNSPFIDISYSADHEVLHNIHT